MKQWSKHSKSSEQLGAFSTAQSGLKKTELSSSTARFMYPKTVSCAMILCTNSKTHQWLVTQADGRRLSWLPGTSGGPDSPVMLPSTSRAATDVTAPRSFLLHPPGG